MKPKCILRKKAYVECVLRPIQVKPLVSQNPVLASHGLIAYGLPDYKAKLLIGHVEIWPAQLGFAPFKAWSWRQEAFLTISGNLLPQPGLQDCHCVHDIRRGNVNVRLLESI